MRYRELVGRIFYLWEEEMSENQEAHGSENQREKSEYEGFLYICTVDPSRILAR